MLRFNSQGLIPAIAQDAGTGDVLMVAFMSRESLLRTIETGQAWFYSRSRRELWHKGATSGNYLNVKRVQIDCDGDTILLTVEPAGPACHTGERTCFFQELTAEQVEASISVDPNRTAQVMNEVFAVIQERQRTRPEKSYTTYLLDQGVDKIGKKIGEEAAEVIIAAKNGTPEPLAMETADLWFHSLVMLAACGLTPADVWSVLRDRRK